MRLTRWNKTAPPADQVLRRMLQMEGLSVLEWTDSSSTIYPAHTHSFVQVRVMLSGHLRVGLPETGEELVLHPGDRLDLPAGTPHWEEVDEGEATTYFAATGADHDHTELNYSSAKSSGSSQSNH